MLFVVSDAVIPETRLGKFARVASFGVIAGFVVMMSLETALGNGSEQVSVRFDPERARSCKGVQQ